MIICCQNGHRTKYEQEHQDYFELDKCPVCHEKILIYDYTEELSLLRKTIQEPANDLRALEIHRLDEALRAIWQEVKKGNLFAIDRFLKISERRSRLLGMDAKTEIALQGEIVAGRLETVRDERWKKIQEQLVDVISKDE